MSNHDEASCAHCMALEWALKAHFHPTDPRHFSGIGRYYPGWSDRSAGVQWSLWHDLHQSRAVLAVNLEGMADGADWPIGRLIERERAEPLLPALAAEAASDVEVWVGRDVWNPGGRGKIRTDDFLDSSVGAISKETWLRALNEAASSQNETGTGRGTLDVLLKKGVRRVCEVSPHLYFAVALWGSGLPTRPERTDRVLSVRSKLEPMHEFLRNRASVQVSTGT